MTAVLAAALLAAAGGSYTTKCGPDGHYFRSTKRDVVVGPLRIVSFRSLFARAREDEVYAPGPHGEKVLKAAVSIVGSRDVTIIVPRAERRRLAFGYKRNDVRTVARGHRAVHFRACARGRRTTGYPGAWIYSGRWNRCLPVDFRIEGRRDTIHRRVPLGAGRCRQPR